MKKNTMNEDVFPIRKRGLSNVMLVFERCNPTRNKQTNKNDEVTFTLPHVRIKGGLRYFLLVRG